MTPLGSHGMGGGEAGPHDEEHHQQYVWPLPPSNALPIYGLPPRPSGLSQPHVMPRTAPDMLHSSQVIWPANILPQFSGPVQAFPVGPTLSLSAPQAFAASALAGQQWNQSVFSGRRLPQTQEPVWAPGLSSPGSTSSAQRTQLPSASAQNEPDASWIACEWPSCKGGFYLDERSLEQHLRTHPQAVGGGPVRCEWAACGSMSELLNLKQHVWDSHLGLRWICERCCCADFSSKRSKIRHVKTCQGASAPSGPAVRCAHCRKACGSQAEMNQHAPACAFLRSPKL